MGRVYDYFSKRNMESLARQDYAKNDKIADERGRYIGVLPKNEAKVLRDTVDQLARKKAQIDGLIDEFHTIYEGYSYMLAGALALLKINPDSFDPRTHDLYVDKNGHAWIVERQQEPT